MNYLLQLKTGTGKLINSDVVDNSQVPELLDIYANRLEEKLLFQGYFGILTREENIKLDGHKHRIKWTFNQACTLFKDKKFVVEVIPD